MSVDTIANMLSTIKNCYLVNRQSVELPYSKQSEAIANVMKEEGYVADVKVFKHEGSSKKGLHLDLAYNESGMPKITDLKRVSKPGRRIYKKSTDVSLVRGGYGLLIVSTPRGIMSGAEARKRHLGGEVICRIW